MISGLAYASLFVVSVSVLWGWYFVGLFSVVVFVADMIDERAHFREDLRRPPYSTRSRRVFTLYVLALAAIAVTVNAVFLITYLLGIYRPPFGEIPL